MSPTHSRISIVHHIHQGNAILQYSTLSRPQLEPPFRAPVRFGLPCQPLAAAQKPGEDMGVGEGCKCNAMLRQMRRRLIAQNSTQRSGEPGSRFQPSSEGAPFALPSVHPPRPAFMAGQNSFLMGNLVSTQMRGLHSNLVTPASPALYPPVVVQRRLGACATCRYLPAINFG